jgi:hypothetical protein
VRYPELLDKRKETKFQWIQNSNKINGDNVNNKGNGSQQAFQQ